MFASVFFDVPENWITLIFLDSLWISSIFHVIYPQLYSLTGSKSHRLIKATLEVGLT